MLDDKKAKSISAIEKARTVTLQKTADSLVQRGIQDIDRLFADLSESKSTAGQPTQDVKRYDPYARYEIGDVIYKEYDEILNVGSTNVEHFRGGIILKVVGKAFYRAFNCEMLEVDYTGGGVFRKYIDYMKKTRTQILLPSNTEARGLVPDIIGVGVNARTPERWMLLHNAAFNGDREMAELLIDNGADVNAKDGRGKTPLYKTLGGDTKVAELLIAKGADVMVRDKDGATPLHWAWNEDAAELLIANGADVNAKDKNGERPLQWAVAKGHKDVAELLITKGAYVNNNGWTPLHEAAEWSNKDIAELLIAKGADVNAKDEDGRTPLHMASLGGYKDVVELLIDNRADVNAIAGASFTPLHLASSEGHKDVAEVLIASGADVNARTPEGWTPLYVATSEGHKDVVELLKKHGAKE